MNSRSEHTTNQETLEEKETQRQWAIQRRRFLEKPLVDALNAAGYGVSSVWDLVNNPEGFPGTVPVLLSHLSKDYDEKVKEGIVRALSVPAARGVAASGLVSEYRKAPRSSDLGLRWAIGNALFVIAEDALFDDIVPLVDDKTNGRSREMLVLALGKMKVKRSSAINVLIGLLRDDEVVAHAIIALTRLNAKEASDEILALQNHPRKLVRDSVKKAIQKFDNTQRK
jgi:hypothetical protein